MELIILWILLFVVFGFILNKVQEYLFIIFLFKIIKNKNTTKEDKRDAFLKLKKLLKQINNKNLLYDLIYNTVFMLIIILKICILLVGIYFCNKLNSI